MQSEVSEFLEYIAVERGLSENTRSAYESDLLRFVEFATVKRLLLETLTPAHLREYLGRLKSDELSSRSLSRKLSALKQFFQFCLREGKIKCNPAELLTVIVKSKRLPKHLSIEESFRLIEVSKGSTEQSVLDYAMMELWYATGCRVSELAKVGCDDIDWKSGLVCLRGKGNRQRWVPLNGDALVAIRNYQTVRHERVRRAGLVDTSTFFLDARLKPFTRQGLWKWLGELAKRAGIRRKVWPHMIRHSFATHVLQGGADLRTVQELLGHKSIATTQVYTHLDVENLKTMQRKYHPRD
jgi:integrase/recombinase XerD